MGRDALEGRWARVQSRLRSKVGEDVFQSWFASVEAEAVREGTIHLSVATKFLRNWIQNHYADTLFECAAAEIGEVERINLFVRERGLAGRKPLDEEVGSTVREEQGQAVAGTANGGRRRVEPVMVGGTDGGGFAGSPLDKRLTFENFVVGDSNQLAQAAARQVAAQTLDQPSRFNPLYLHSSVGLGKTHLLHAIAWEVKRRNANAQVLYLTAERFRYKFVEALRREDALSFKERLRSIDILLLDDMEFLQGERTEQEFDHTLNALLDGGKQVVVASARAPMQLDSLDQRMRSRLSGGLVAEIDALDYDLRLKILERRIEEKRQVDPSFDVGREIMEFLAEKLTEGGRELDGAVTRLYAACHLAGTPITVDSAEHIIRDLMRGIEPKRIKIEDILRVVSKHFGVSRTDILSQRRHRSIVWPRQVGMFLSKALTARSLPEIGRRFGGRDHTTVLHAIRKIEGELKGNSRLRAEIEDLKRLLNG